jgi:hypothetical protein
MKKAPFILLAVVLLTTIVLARNQVNSHNLLANCQDDYGPLSLTRAMPGPTPVDLNSGKNSLKNYLEFLKYNPRIYISLLPLPNGFLQ